MPTLQAATELVANPIPTRNGRWAVRCRLCSSDDTGTVGVGLEDVSLRLDLAQLAADLHNRVIHGIDNGR